jgi:NAD(P)H-dependent FMN reductase
MKKIIALTGSNSKASINKKLVNYTSKTLEHVEVIQLDLNDYELPFYGIDYESENGIPSLVNELHKIFEKADGFVISLAEHNGSYAAVFKNIIDWLSRINTEIWHQKPMLLMSTSPGGRGGATVLQSALSTFPFLGAGIIESFALPSFHQNFSDGQITDPSFRKEHGQKVANFLKAIH